MTSHTNNALCYFLTAKLEPNTQNRMNTNSTLELQVTSLQCTAGEVTKSTGTNKLQQQDSGRLLGQDSALKRSEFFRDKRDRPGEQFG